MERKILRSAVSKFGYEVREESVTINDTDEPVIMISCYTPKGDYLGDRDTVKHLIKEYGITQFEAHEGSTSRVVAMGYSPTAMRWYGWSHRALAGFGIGDKIFEAEFGDDQTPFIEHGTETIETLEQAFQAAKAFAEYVS